MSIIFGIRKPGGDSLRRSDLIHMARATSRWAPDGTFVQTQDVIGMGFQPYHTHPRSKIGMQPATDELGNVAVLDGRIDNYRELSHLLHLVDHELSDLLIALAAFRNWGENCFARFVGDWALAIWSQRQRCLYLARDHAGTRTLYYEMRSDQALWSTSLETFFAWEETRSLSESYVAKYLCCQPIRDLTPYEGIAAVPPGHYVMLPDSAAPRINNHWTWMAKNTICYRSDAEYEAHFLHLLRQSVGRRTGAGAPILAELSGGMDSTSIVCVSDQMRYSQGASPRELLDTLSYYDESEPNWDERPYFTAVEMQRRKAGFHVNISTRERTFAPADLPEGYIPRLPGLDQYGVDHEKHARSAVSRGGYRVILSGIGGDELLGGVPTPLPELADLLISCKFRELVLKTLQFCVPERTPLLHMLGRTIASVVSTYIAPAAERTKAPPWISSRLENLTESEHRDMVSSSRIARFSFMPSSIENGITWWRMLETLPHLAPSAFSHYEYRYPYLDRDLVDYLHRIPRDQLVRPGRRRSLMRRALVGIVPDQVLERRRKASLIRGPLVSLQRSEQAIRAIFDASLLRELGLIDATSINETLAVITRGTEPRWWPAILKATTLEFWLQRQTGTLKCVGAKRAECMPLLHRNCGAGEIRTGSTAL
jgi:asparagine synthase (glutamine-hydrolysing)